MSLRDKIVFAFSRTPYPGDNALTSCNCEDCRWEVARLRGKKWTRLTLDDFGAEDGDANVALLLPAAFHYYLPGLLLLLVDHPEAQDWLLDRVLSRLAVPAIADAELRSRVEGIVKRLSAEQREAVTAVIEQVTANEQAIHVQSALSNLRDGAVTPYGVTLVLPPERL